MGIMITKQFNIIAPITKTTTSDDGEVYIEGIANTGQEDLAGDIVTIDALQQIVDQLPNRNLHLDHDKDFEGILGPIIDSELRDEGAWFKARLINERKDIIQSYLEQGVHFGTSISGDCTYEEGSHSNIISWDLVELSLTDIPCDQGTMGTVSLSKSFDGIIKTIKNKQIMEDNKMADEENYTTEEAVIELINTAFNERKEEFLEQIRDELKQEYESIIGELTSRIEALENNETSTSNDDGTDDDKDGQEDEDEEEKSVEELVDKKVSEIFSNLTKNTNFQYQEEKGKDSENKSFTPHDIASL